MSLYNIIARTYVVVASSICSTSSIVDILIQYTSKIHNYAIRMEGINPSCQWCLSSVRKSVLTYIVMEYTYVRTYIK